MFSKVDITSPPPPFFESYFWKNSVQGVTGTRPASGEVLLTRHMSSELVALLLPP